MGGVPRARRALVVLDLGGEVTSAAEELHVHRATLHYRLNRIAELTGVDLRSGSDRTSLRLALWLAAYRGTEDQSRDEAFDRCRRPWHSLLSAVDAASARPDPASPASTLLYVTAGCMPPPVVSLRGDLWPAVDIACLCGAGRLSGPNCRRVLISRPCLRITSAS
ncbi:helix-turn-helix domain-containing protein [Streptomyces brasiliscabiei]|uniref:helix-turn-helix domain-containing protein n=1 Tax=Streptomyces brasiliscabiei TaxID=2736302 RepID=UPI0038F6C46A